MSQIRLSGFGDEYVNGIYNQVGTHDGYPYYEKTTNDYIIIYKLENGPYSFSPYYWIEKVKKIYPGVVPKITPKYRGTGTNVLTAVWISVCDITSGDLNVGVFDPLSSSSSSSSTSSEGYSTSSSSSSSSGGYSSSSSSSSIDSSSSSSSDLDFILKVKTDNIGTSNDNQFTLPLKTGETYDFVVYFDNTSISHNTDSDLTLTFSSGIGIYDIRISGDFPAIYFNNYKDNNKVLEIKQWGSGINWTTFNSSFSGCQYLNITATDEPNSSSVTDFSRAWYECINLTSFPEIDTSSATNFEYTWYSCNSLTSFPQINTSSATNLNSTWGNCSGLTSFPLLDTSSVTNMESAWENCSGLTSFPLLDTSSCEYMSETWGGCSGLTSFPLLDTSSVTDMVSSWENCSGLTSFPLINTSSVTDMELAWGGCSGLTSFPLLDTSSCEVFFDTWNGCSGLTSFPELDSSSVTDFEAAWYECVGLNGYNFPTLNMSLMEYGDETFYGVTLSTESYSNLLIYISENNINTGITLDGGNSLYNESGEVARNELISRDWDITDGGLS